MTARSTPMVRIGDAERAEAQRVLQHHLNAGRLQLAEFVDRFGRAAESVTAADVAALFADLPPPHPTLPDAPGERIRRQLVIVGAVAALAFVGSLGFVIGLGQSAPPSSAVVGPMPSASPATESAPAVPARSAVRRTTGPGLITLYPSDGVDLDDLTDPTWSAGVGCCGRDVGFGSDARQLLIDNGYAVATGPPAFATCLHEPAYRTPAIERTGLRSGESLCVRTNDHRLALVTIVNASGESIEFGVTVWDPPVPS